MMAPPVDVAGPRPRFERCGGSSEVEVEVVFRGRGRARAPGSGEAEFVVFWGLARVRALGRAERSSPSSGA
jgi:hypothetical protein